MSDDAFAADLMNAFQDVHRAATDIVPPGMLERNRGEGTPGPTPTSPPAQMLARFVDTEVAPLAAAHQRAVEEAC